MFVDSAPDNFFEPGIEMGACASFNFTQEPIMTDCIGS